MQECFKIMANEAIFFTYIIPHSHRAQQSGSTSTGTHAHAPKDVHPSSHTAKKL